MRLRVDRACLVMCAFMLLAAGQVANAGSDDAAQRAGSVPDDVAVQKAITAVRQDPLMGGVHMVKRLHWLDSDKPERRSHLQPWLVRLIEWIAAFARWLAGSARALVIVAAVIGAALLAIVIVRALRRSGAGTLRDEAEPPTHVRGLDIRPDELPEDVARAARTVWGRGDRRGAMVLLYRAVLSRLVHGYRVPIRDSSTEGDCQRLATKVLASAAQGYVAHFIGSWQRAMYAAVWPGELDFEQLCAGFEQALPTQAAGAVAGSGGSGGAIAPGALRI